MCINKNKRKDKMPTKKTTTKRTVVKKAAVKSAPVMEHRCECGCGGHCHCHGGAHWLKHIIVWAIIFALGMVCGKMMYCGHGMKHMPKMQPVFVNGCLDVSSVKCPMMQEKLANADANADNCVSMEEFKAVKKTMRHGRKGMRGPKPEPKMAD